MSFSDPLGDMLTRIRNGQMASHQYVMSPFSKMRQNVLDVLKREGFIQSFEKVKGDDGHMQIRIELKYFEDAPVIKEMRRISKPGRRVYSSVKELTPIYNGLGISILSTPQGVLSDNEARTKNVGGEVLCSVF